MHGTRSTFLTYLGSWPVWQIGLVPWLVLCAAIAGTVGCASQEKLRIRADHRMTYTDNTNQTGTIEPGVEVEIPSRATSFSVDGHKTVILVPVPKASETIQLVLPPESKSEDSSRTGGTGASNAVLAEFVAIQNLLAKRRTDEALARIQVAKSAYAGIHYFSYLEASCYALKGDMKTAQTIALKTYREIPTDDAAADFLSSMGMDPNTGSSKKRLPAAQEPDLGDDPKPAGEP